MKRSSTFRVATILSGVALIGLATAASGQATLYRLAADQQLNGERLSSTEDSAGGTLVYTKTVSNPGARTYVTFNAQGDTHGGAALLMACYLDGVPCELGSGAADSDAEWSTLNKVPTSSGNTNCNDGGGGSADCHDNTIHKTWCMHSYPGVHTVTLKLATDTAGETVFYERATITIDGSTWDPNIVCGHSGH